MDPSRRLCFLMTALAMAGLLAVACDSGTQEPAAPDPSTPLTSSNVTDPQSDSTILSEMPEGLAASIPETFADEVPIYPGSTPALSKGAMVGEVPIAGVHLQTTDTPKKVYEFYADKLSHEGWKLENNPGLEGKNAISATNGKCKALMLAAPAEDGGTNIILVTEC